MKKLKLEELGRMDVAAFKAASKTPIIIVLDNIFNIVLYFKDLLNQLQLLGYHLKKGSLAKVGQVNSACNQYSVPRRKHILQFFKWY